MIFCRIDQTGSTSFPNSLRNINLIDCQKIPSLINSNGSSSNCNNSYSSAKISKISEERYECKFRFFSRASKPSTLPKASDCNIELEDDLAIDEATHAQAIHFEIGDVVMISGEELERREVLLHSDDSEPHLESHIWLPRFLSLSRATILGIQQHHESDHGNSSNEVLLTVSADKYELCCAVSSI